MSQKLRVQSSRVIGIGAMSWVGSHNCFVERFIRGSQPGHRLLRVQTVANNSHTHLHMLAPRGGELAWATINHEGLPDNFW